MKKNDRLIETVFDSPESLASLHLDAASQKEVETLSTLKADLKRLRDVPECQLTVEHLRHAVLNQKPSPTARPALRLWTWVPVAAAATLALVMVTKPSDLVSPKAPTEVATKSPLPSGDGASTVHQSAAVASDAMAKAEPLRTTSVVARGERTRPIRTTRRSSATMTVAAVTKAIEEVALEAVGERSASPVLDAYPAGVTMSAEVESNDETPVVVVGDTRNPETGAAEAQEISRPSDVVFGG